VRNLTFQSGDCGYPGPLSPALERSERDRFRILEARVLLFAARNRISPGETTLVQVMTGSGPKLFPQWRPAVESIMSLNIDLSKEIN
jgi:hypothetical protein